MHVHTVTTTGDPATTLASPLSHILIKGSDRGQEEAVTANFVVTLCIYAASSQHHHHNSLPEVSQIVTGSFDP